MAKQKNRDIVFDSFPSAPEFKAGVNHLLAIGIDDYQHVAKLSNAVRDAKAFVKLMQDKYDFSTENTYTLYDGDACKHKITATFRDLIDKVDKVNDNVVIYFSGHGHYDQLLKEGYWVPTDAQFKAEVDYISYSYIKKVVKAIPSHHTVMIVDSCYSGSVLMGSRDLMADRVEKDPSRWMVASGRNEVVPDGVIGGNSPFAENLLSILERYSGQGLRLGKLVEKLTTAVSYNSTQTPIGRPMYEVGDQGGEFFFHPKQTPQKAWAKAQQENSVAAYTFFLTKYPNSQFTDAAQKKLVQMQAAPPVIDTKPTAPLITNTAPTTIEKAPAVRTVGSIPKSNTASVTSASGISKKQLIISGSIALALIIIGIFGYIRSEYNKAERCTLEGKVLFNEGKFQGALEKGETALLSVHDYEDAKQLTSQATKGINAQTFLQRGQDSLKLNRHNEAIRLFKEALSIYNNISYAAGSSKATQIIQAAEDSKITYDEKEKIKLANSAEEIKQIHEASQEEFKNLAYSYYLQGEYREAIKHYIDLDDTLEVTNELAMARLGAAGKLPEMMPVTGHANGDFTISKYETTNEQFCAFLNATAKHADEQGMVLINFNKSYTAIVPEGGKYIILDEAANKNRPVTGVNWYGANAYSKWAGGQLPSPEQWKYAAREGSNKSNYEFSGSNNVNEVAVYYREGDRRSYPAEVGTKAPNKLGIYDMSGNAWEWSSNGSETANKQAILGGSINRGQSHAVINSSYSVILSTFKSNSNNNDLGFRMIRMIPKQTTEEDVAN